MSQHDPGAPVKSGWKATEMFFGGSIAASAVQIADKDVHPLVQLGALVVAGAIACWYAWLRTTAKHPESRKPTPPVIVTTPSAPAPSVQVVAGGAP